MAQVRTDALPWIHQRCCPRCGYAGWELQRLDERSPYQCPSCDEDLYARVPMTYAEREGLVPVTGAQPQSPAIALRRQTLIVRLYRGLRSFFRRSVIRG